MHLNIRLANPYSEEAANSILPFSAKYVGHTMTELFTYGCGSMASMYQNLFESTITPVTEEQGDPVTVEEIYAAEDEIADKEKNQRVREEEHNSEVEEKQQERDDEVAEAAGVDTSTTEDAIDTADDSMPESEDVSDDESDEKSEEEKDEEAKALYLNRWRDDAADVVILDNDIAEVKRPAEADEDVAEPIGDAAELGEPAGDEEGDSETMLLTYMDLSRQYDVMYNVSSGAIGRIAGDESLIWGVVKHLAAVAVRLAFAAARQARRAVDFCINKCMKSFVKAEWAAAYYNERIAEYINKVDHERLNNRKLEAYPYEVYMSVAKYSISLFDTVLSGKRFVFDNAPEARSGTMNNLIKTGAGLGIKFDLPKATTSFDDLADKRRLEACPELGYNPSVLPNIIRYFSEMKKRIPSKKAEEVKKAMAEIAEAISQYGAGIDDDVSNGKIKEDSKEYKKAMDRLMHLNVRYSFLAACVKLSGFLFAQLVDDAVNVFKVYENCIIAKSLE